MDVYLLMRMEVDEIDYSELLSFNAFRRSSVFGGRKGLLMFCLVEYFDCRLTRLIYS